MLMNLNGVTVAVVGGTLRVKLPTGEQQIVPWEQLEIIEGLQDRGKTAEGEQWVRVVYERDAKGLGKAYGVESNGVWPEDIARFLLDALKVIVKENQK